MNTSESSVRLAKNPSSTLRMEVVGDHVRWVSSVGEVLLPRVQKAVFQYEMKGHYDTATMTLIWRLFDEFAAEHPGKLHAFADMSGLTGYDSEARRLAARGFSDRSARWDTFHALMPSDLAFRMLSMAFGTINMLSRVPMKTYTNKLLFEAARKAATQGP